MPPKDMNMSANPGMGEGDIAASMQGAPMGAPAGSPADGSVMLSMPKEIFDTVNMLVSELSQALKAASMAVEGQKGGTMAYGGTESPEEEAMESADQEAQEPLSEDEKFLKSIAQEGSKKY